MMGDSIDDETKQLYAKKKTELREKADALRRELRTTMDNKKNESLKEV